MGVKTPISLDELNKIFPSFGFIRLTPTVSGIIDTTYVVFTETDSYILKRYEREIPTKIAQDIELLDELKSAELNVPTCIDKNSGWYLYEKLRGEQPKVIKTYHIQELARFLAKLHTNTYKMRCNSNIISQDEISKLLKYTKSNFFGYYKKLVFLKDYSSKKDGLIHGDIFKDNTVFNDTKIGVFDFIDSTCGSFAFDVGVILVAFDAASHNHYFINLFVNTYNQSAPKRLNKKEVLKYLHIASSFYALKRINEYKNTKKAKELIRWI